MAEKLYFAYGSNINLEQMEYRCPAAKAVGPVILENYELLFRGNAKGKRRGHHRTQGRKSRCTACCGGSPQSVNSLWISTRAIPGCMKKSG